MRPGYLGARERSHDVLLRDAQQLADGNGGQRVVHVEEARHGEHAAALPAGGVGNKLHVAVAGLDVRGPDVSALAPLRREAQHTRAAAGALGNDVGMLAVHVDHGGAADVKDAQLALEVVLKVRVLHGRDVVAPDVEEAGHVKREAQHAVVLEALA